MKNLPFENTKHRLLWKILLHTLSVLIFPIAPIAAACKMFGLFKQQTTTRYRLIFIILIIAAATYAIQFFVGKLRVLPETSDKRRVFKYTMLGAVDTLPWAAILIFLAFTYNIVKKHINAPIETVTVTLYSGFLLLIILVLIIAACKIVSIWLNALLIKYLEIVDEDAERGYLLGKAFKYKDKQ